MNGFAGAFNRQSDGSWICVAAAEWIGPMGRIQVSRGSRFFPGTTFMGVDLAKLLDENARQDDNHR